MNKYYTYLENIEERNKHSLKKEIKVVWDSRFIKEVHSAVFRLPT